jgi:CheY-like chemotaxis protein
VRDNLREPGSVFWFQIPYLLSEEEAARCAKIQRQRELPETLDFGQSFKEATCAQNEADGMQSILIIDDTPSSQLQAQELTALGYKVDIGLGSSHGMNMMKRKQYGMVFCDIKMPNHNGDELCKAFRHWEAFNRPVGQVQPIYALSAYTNENIRRRCLEARPHLDATILTCVRVLPGGDQRVGCQANRARQGSGSHAKALLSGPGVGVSRV